MDMKEEIARKRKEQWYELVFSVEVLAVEKELAEASLAEHVKKIENAPGVFVYEKYFYDVKEVENPMKNVEKGYSQVVTLKLFIKDLYTTLTAIMLFGPSAIEVLGPDKKEIAVSEIQDIANNVASLVHQFAAAGVGGMVISPGTKRRD